MGSGKKYRLAIALATSLAIGAEARTAGSAADRLLASLEDPALRDFVREALASNPAIAAASARARAALNRAPQVRALPDPVASLTAFLETPETRTGSQLFSLGESQSLPWFGKLALKERAALYGAAALDAEAEAARLALVTEARRLFYELAFLERHRRITEDFLAHLVQHEEIARGRYSTGVGLGQGVVKLQAEITRVEKQLLDLESRRVSRTAELNALRARRADAELPAATSDLLGQPAEVAIDLDRFGERAMRSRPELPGADARIAHAETLVRLAEKNRRPDFKLGLLYTVVDPRDDTPGRLQPPEGNGDDVLGVQGGITLPIRRGKLAAGVDQAAELETAAREARRELVSNIEAGLGDLAQRVPLAWREYRLVEDLLIVQAEEALQSAQAGYITGTLNALDLLDAEHVLFDANTARARSAADYLINLAQLEGALGEPIDFASRTEQPE